MMSINKSTVIWTIIIILVILNIATLTSMWLHKPQATKKVELRGFRPGGHFIEGRLNFSEEQAIEYRRLRSTFFEQASPYFEKIRTNKRHLYGNLKTSGDQKDITALADTLGQLHAELEMITFNHFKDVRNLADSTQKAAFDSLMVNIVDRANQPSPHMDDRDGDARWRKSHKYKD